MTFQRRLLHLGLATVLLILLVFLALGFWVDRRMDRELAAVAEQGQTLSLEAFFEKPEDEENASLGLDAAIALLRLAPTEQPSLDAVAQLPLDRPPNAQEKDAIESLLAIPQYRMALELLDLQSELEQARYLGADADGPGLPARIERYLEHRTLVFRLALLLRVRAAAAIDAGAPEEAYEDILLHFRIADWLRQEMPLAIGHVLANGLAHRGLDLLEQVSQVAQPEDPESLLTALDQLDEGEAVDSLRGERAYLYQMTRRQGQLEVFFGSQDSPGLLAHLYSRFWGEQGETAAYLQAFRETMEHFEQPPTQRGDWHWKRLRTSPFGIPAEFLIPNLLDSVKRNEELRVRAAMARHALELARNPESSPPSDLFTDESLLLSAEGDTPQLLSPGRDLQLGTEHDLSWRLLPVATQGNTTAESSS